MSTTITIDSLNNSYPANWHDDWDGTFKIIGNDEGEDYGVDVNNLKIVATGLSISVESESEILSQLSEYYRMDNV